MAKAKISYLHILCVLICSSAISQSPLAGNASDKLLASPGEKRDCLRELYLSQVGVREQGGNNRDPHVKTYLNAVGLGESYPWCAAVRRETH